MPPHLDRPANMTRVLTAARRLVIERGARKVSVAEIAAAAGVGKGTVYLYWPGKEELVVSLVAAAAADGLRALATGLRRDAGAAVPGRLAGDVLTAHAADPLARALDDDPLMTRMLAEGTVADEVARAASPWAVCTGLVPILRDHGLVRADIAPDALAYGVHCLVTGAITHVQVPALAGEPDDAERARLFREAVDAFVGGPRPPAPDETALAAAAGAMAERLDGWADDLDRYQLPHPAA